MTTPETDPFELVGTTIAGKYEVGEGGRAHRSVRRLPGHPPRLAAPVAIKAFTAPALSEAARQQLLASFVEEGRLLMDLSERCAAICQARDVSSLTTAEGDWVPYTVLEWLDGECLEEAMLPRARRGRPPADARRGHRAPEPRSPRRWPSRTSAASSIAT